MTVCNTPSVCVGESVVIQFQEASYSTDPVSSWTHLKRKIIGANLQIPHYILHFNSPESLTDFTLVLPTFFNFKAETVAKPNRQTKMPALYLGKDIGRTVAVAMM